MNDRVRWTIIASPFAVLLLLLVAPDAANGTTWALTLLASILASGAAFAMR